MGVSGGKGHGCNIACRDLAAAVTCCMSGTHVVLAAPVCTLSLNPHPLAPLCSILGSMQVQIFSLTAIPPRACTCQELSWSLPQVYLAHSLTMPDPFFAFGKSQDFPNAKNGSGIVKDQSKKFSAVCTKHTNFPLSCPFSLSRSSCEFVSLLSFE